FPVAPGLVDRVEREPALRTHHTRVHLFRQNTRWTDSRISDYYRGMAERKPLHVPVHPVRFVTAASLFDGHDASINIMRRILQSQGAEVIHLGHNRSVDEVLVACLQ